jgi:MFS family permease
MVHSSGPAGADLDQIRRRLDEAPMNSGRLAAVALAVLISALDGYDVLSVTFAAPAIAQDWKIGREALGVLLSSGLMGMAAGSLLLAPVADFIGRRRLVLFCLAIMGVGMLLSSRAASLGELAGWRVLTGVGIGACVALIVSIASEFSNARRRAFALSAVAMGYPAGGVLGGLLAAWLLGVATWHAVFFAGFVVALLLLPAVALWLPESPSFLLARGRASALPRINRVLKRCGQPAIDALPPTRARAPSGYAAVFSGARVANTLRVMLVNLLLAFSSYYVLSWMPQLVADLGFAPSTASLVSSSANLAGIAGGLLLGAFAQRLGPKLLTVAAIIGLGFATAYFGYAPPILGVQVASAAACGFFMFSSAAGMYGVVARAFPDDARASGSGFIFGVGRIGSAIAPMLAGWLFASGLGRDTASAAFGACAVVAGLILLTGRTQPGEAPSAARTPLATNDAG